MRRKKSFVLLEILIGFALMSATILPFLRYPYRHMQKELDLLFEMQLTRFAQKRLCDLETAIYRGEVDPERIFGGEQKWPPLSESDRVITLQSQKWQRVFRETAKVYWSSQKLSEDKVQYSLVHLVIEYKHKKHKTLSFHTELIARKKI